MILVLTEGYYNLGSCEQTITDHGKMELYNERTRGGTECKDEEKNGKHYEKISEEMG